MSNHAELFRAIDYAPSERAIGVALMEMSQALTGAPKIGFYTMRSPNVVGEVHVRGVNENQLQYYEESMRGLDPLMRWVSEHHVVALADLKTLCAMDARCHDFLDSGIYSQLSQYLLAPIVVGGELVGTINFAKLSGARFDARAVRLASALMLHVSTRVAVLRAAEGFSTGWDGALPRRELEIAQLAVRGLSTAQMARAAGISSNTVKKHLKALYRKLGVGSRVELGELLLRGPAALSEREIAPKPIALASGAAAFIHD